MITSGLKAGETLITSGFAKLTDGAKVVPSADPAEAAKDKTPAAIHEGGVSPPTDTTAGAPARAAPPRRWPAAEQRRRMNVSALFIRRPVATFLLAVAVLLGGVLGYSFLPVSALPQVDFPTIQVTTQLPGANPDTMAAARYSAAGAPARPDSRP